MWPLVVALSLSVSTAFSDSDTSNAANSNTAHLKTGDMPASVVLLLLFMFSSLALICVRHVRREYARHEHFLCARKSGAQVSLDSIDITTKSYGSTRAPRLDSATIDDYIDDQLYGNWPLLERLEHYRRSIEQRIVARLERTPEPVLYEVGHDASVSAFCENPEIPFAPGDAELAARPFVHSASYRAKPSAAMETLMLRNARRNQRRRKIEAEAEEKSEYEQIEERQTQTAEMEQNSNGRVSSDLRSRMDLADFDDDEDGEHAMYGAYPADGSGDEEYDALAGVDSVLEDDDGICSEDDGNCEDADADADGEHMTHKVVRLDVE